MKVLKKCTTVCGVDGTKERVSHIKQWDKLCYRASTAVRQQKKHTMLLSSGTPSMLYSAVKIRPTRQCRHICLVFLERRSNVFVAEVTTPKFCVYIEKTYIQKNELASSRIFRISAPNTTTRKYYLHTALHVVNTLTMKRT